MKFFLNTVYIIVRFIRAIRRKIKVYDLQLRGVSVHPSAVIDPRAIFEPAGGKITIGARTFIDCGVILRPLGGFITIDNDCSVNAYSILYGAGGLSIGKGVRIAAHTAIIPSNHLFEDANQSIHLQGVSAKGIVIEDDVWIGSGVKILDEVLVRRGTVVGAGAVVTRSTEPFSVVVGIPAGVIKYRK